MVLVSLCGDLRPVYARERKLSIDVEYLLFYYPAMSRYYLRLIVIIARVAVWPSRPIGRSASEIVSATETAIVRA